MSSSESPLPSQPPTLRRAAARSAAVAAGASLIVQAVTFATYIVLAHLAPPSVFGAFAAGSVLLGVGGLFSESGMTAALVQRRENIDAAAATTLVSTFTGGVLLALVSLLLSPIVAILFHSRQIGYVSAALSGYLVINGITGVPATLLRKRLSLRRWIVEPLAACALGVVSGVGLALDLQVWGLVMGFYASGVTRAGGYWIVAQWRPNLRFVSFGMWRDLARFARHILASELLREAMNVATTTLIGRFLGPASLGQFRFGWRLVTQASAPAMVANAYTLQPALVRLSDDRDRMRRATLSSFRLVSIVAFPLGALFIPLGESLAVLLFGDAWRQSGPIMVALAGMGIALPMESVSSEIFKASGRPDILPRMHVLWAVMSIGLIAGFVHLGAVAVAIAWSVSTICTALYALSRVPRVLNLRPIELARVILPPLVAALTTAIGLLLLNKFAFPARPDESLPTLLRTLLELVIGAIVYVGIMALLAPQALVEFHHTIASMLDRRPTVQAARSGSR